MRGLLGLPRTGPLISCDCRTLLRAGDARWRVCDSSQVNLAPALPAGAQKVPYNVLAQPVGLRAEHPPTVPSGDFLDKCGQAFVIDEHKYVKQGPPPGH